MSGRAWGMRGAWGVGGAWRRLRPRLPGCEWSQAQLKALDSELFLREFFHRAKQKSCEHAADPALVLSPLCAWGPEAPVGAGMVPGSVRRRRARQKPALAPPDFCSRLRLGTTGESGPQ